MELTDKTIRAATASAQPRFLWDKSVSGFGLKVNPGGTKIFVLQFRKNGGRAASRRITIGRFGVLGTAEARNLARSILADVHLGLEPKHVWLRGPKGKRTRPKVGADAQTTDQRIIAAARRVFLDHGYNARLDDVSRAAGVSRQTLYARQHSKQNLLRLVVESIIEGQTKTPVPNPGRSIHATLEAYGEYYLNLSLDPDGLKVYRLMAFDLRGFPDLRRSLYEISRRNIETPLRNYLVAKMETGEIFRGDATLLAAHFLQAVLGHARDFALFEFMTDPKPDLQSLKQTVDVFLTGILKRP